MNFDPAEIPPRDVHRYGVGGADIPPSDSESAEDDSSIEEARPLAERNITDQTGTGGGLLSWINPFTYRPFQWGLRWVGRQAAPAVIEGGVQAVRDQTIGWLEQFRRDNPEMAQLLSTEDVEGIVQQVGTDAQHGPQWALGRLLAIAREKATSRGFEDYAARLAVQRYEAVVGRLADEALPVETLEAELPEHTVQVVNRLQGLSTRIIDHYRENALRDFGEERQHLVIDLGVQREEGAPAEGVGGQLPAEIDPDDPYIYIPAPQDFVENTLGRDVWIRRDRQQLQQEIRHCLLVGMHNLHHAMRDHANPNLVHDVVAEAVVAAGNHTHQYFDYVRDETRGPHLTPEGKRGYVRDHFEGHHPVFNGANSPKEFAAAQNQHAHEIGKSILKLMFPNGAADLPVPAHYRPILYSLLLPELSQAVLQNVMQVMTSERVINNVLYRLLEQVPSAREVQITREQQTVVVNPNLVRAGGDILLDLGRLTDSRIEKLLQGSRWIHRLFGGTAETGLIERKIKESLGHLLGTILEEMIAQHSTPERALNALEKLFMEEWLNAAVDNFDEQDWENIGGKELSAQESAQGLGVGDHTAEEVQQQMARIVEDFEPYAVKAVYQGLYNARIEALQRIDNTLVRTFRRVGAELGRFKGWVLAHAGRGLGAVGRAILKGVGAILWFLGVKKQKEIDTKVHAADAAARMYTHVHDAEIHQNLIRHLVDILKNKVDETVERRPAPVQMVEEDSEFDSVEGEEDD